MIILPPTKKVGGMRIFLLGFMGVGKSTLGKMLAERLEHPFIDMDNLIVEKMEEPIEHIFSNYGELFFRKLEHDYLREVVQTHENLVMGTGGGLPCHANNMTFMNESGLTVYLKADAQSIVYRLSHSSHVRPLIADKEGEKLSEYIRALLQQRSPIYEQAQIVVDLDLRSTKRENTDRLLDQIKNKLLD